MDETIKQPQPINYSLIQHATAEAGFNMASEILTCTLLRVLAASKPGGKFLELGTGTGLSTSWILDGMDNNAELESVDNDKAVLDIAKRFLQNDNRLTLSLMDGESWVHQHKGDSYDFIFADTWHGKYLLLDEVLAMLKPGAIYIIDDMLPQENWPEGHAEKATQLLIELEQHNDLLLVKQNWASGIVIAVKRGG